MTFNYDSCGRVTSIAGNLDGETQIVYREAAGDRDPALRHPDLAAAITDANGVTRRFTYDDAGRIRQISIDGGPTFRYDYDENGQQEGVQVDDLRVNYGEYAMGLPGSIAWRGPGGTAVDFALTRTASGRLDRIEGGGYLLDLDWDESAGGAEPCGEELAGPASIIGLVRQGPDMLEALTPSYDGDGRLTARTIAATTHTITEDYGAIQHQLHAGLSRDFDSTTLLDLKLALDAAAEDRRIAAWDLGSGAMTIDYDPLGNLEALDYDGSASQTFVYDGERRQRQGSRDI